MSQRAFFGFLVALLPPLQQCGQTMWDATEAEAAEFDASDVNDLRFLNKKGAEKVKKLLRSPELDFLGDWRNNASAFYNWNRDLVMGRLVWIESFLQPAVAEEFYEELVQLERQGGFVIGGGGGLGPYSPDADMQPSAVCRDFYVANQQKGFEHQTHDLELRSRQAVERAKSGKPAMTKVMEGLGSIAWRQATNLLLTGSGMHVTGRHPERRVLPNGGFEVEPGLVWNVSFREVRDGDYMGIHHDSRDESVLTLNAWLVSQQWKKEWGGPFLWCGSDEAGTSFPEAFSWPPAFNAAHFFIPNKPRTYHAIPMVKKPVGTQAHRFSFTQFLAVKQASGQHHEVLMQKQTRLQTRRLPERGSEL